MTDFALLVLPSTVPQALDGDYTLLVRKLRLNHMLHQSERDFLADLLEGKPRKRGRKGNKTVERDMCTLQAVNWLVKQEGWGRDAAQMKVAELTNESDRNVRKRIKRGDNGRGVHHTVIQGNLANMRQGVSEKTFMERLSRYLRNKKS